MSTAQVDDSQRWTAERLVELPEDGRRYEIVDGQLLVSPRERWSNTRMANRLARQLDRQLPAGWEVSVDMALSLGGDLRSPDVGVLRAEVDETPGHVGLPPAYWALAVEIVSPSSRKTDRLFKPAEYAEAGVPAFWRLETDPELVLHTYQLVDGGYAERAVVSGMGTVDVPFPMTIDLTALI